jgi:glycosyltransferase involved in cell wall biosynthesis
MSSGSSLAILHVLRAPVGGLFRHVADLARTQAARGCKVGIVADSLTGGPRGEALLSELSPALSLGISRVAMPRNPSILDVSAIRHATGRIKAVRPDVVHGHGSKGGLYARCATRLAGSDAIVAYTPHGGSFNYHPGTFAHRVYMAIESALRPLTDLYLFESAFVRERMLEEAGPTKALQRVVWNGISEAELSPVVTAPDADDFFYIGELREVKGVDTLLDALALIHARSAARPRLTLIGAGPDRTMLEARRDALGLGSYVTFAGQMPARQAFTRGRVMVVPSRAESLPYVVLEAAGARVPLIATTVGGVPEIFGPQADRLIACGDAGLLARRMSDTLAMSPQALAREAEDLFEFVARAFTIDGMVNAVLEGYRDALSARHFDAAAALAHSVAMRFAKNV